MAIIYTYPQKSDLSPSDRIVLSDADDGFSTKYVTVQQIIDQVPEFVPGSGTVTEIAATTSLAGLSFAGSPIQTSGTLSLEGTLEISSGGTGQTDALSAIIALTQAADWQGAYVNNPSGSGMLELPGVLQVYNTTQTGGSDPKSVRWTQDYVHSLSLESGVLNSTGRGLSLTDGLKIGEVRLQTHIFDGGLNIGFVPPIGEENQDRRFLNGQGNWVIPSTNSYSLFTIQSPGLVNANSSQTGQFLRDDGSWAAPANSTYPVFSAGVNGLVPGVNSTGTGSKYLADDAQWKEVAGSENLGITPLDIYQGKTTVDLQDKVIMIQTVSDTTFYCNYIHFACLNKPETGLVSFAIYKGEFSSTIPTYLGTYSYDSTTPDNGEIVHCANIQQTMDSIQIEAGARYLIGISCNADFELLGIDDGILNSQIAITKTGFYEQGK